jgi:hypothetical protein
LEERGDQVTQRGLPGLLRGDGGQVDIAEAIPLVLQIALAFQQVQHGPHSRIAGRIRQFCSNLSDTGFAQAVDSIDDLTLPPAEVV